jgi:hypothetical protein
VALTDALDVNAGLGAAQRLFADAQTAGAAQAQVGGNGTVFKNVLQELNRLLETIVILCSGSRIEQIPGDQIARPLPGYPANTGIGWRQTEAHGRRRLGEVALGDGQDALVRRHRIASYQQAGASCPDDADASRAPVKHIAAASFCEMAQKNNGAPSMLGHFGQAVQAAADVLVLATVNVAAEKGDKGIEDEQPGSGLFDDPKNYR